MEITGYLVSSRIWIINIPKCNEGMKATMICEIPDALVEPQPQAQTCHFEFMSELFSVIKDVMLVSISEVFFYA